MQLCCIMATICKEHGQAMNTAPPHHRLHLPVRPNSALCAGVAQRMAWAALALALLWITINWALS